METEASKNVPLSERGISTAIKLLENRGYEILERNWTCDAGTIDIIAKQDEEVVFITVKVRSRYFDGFPEEAISRQRIKKLEGIACAYLKNFDQECKVRFDEIAVLVINDSHTMVKHSVNITGEKLETDVIKQAERCLIDNGISPDEAQTVLQALGYILLNKDLYLA